MVGLHVGVMVLVNFADLATGMLISCTCSLSTRHGFHRSNPRINPPD
jgi:hypothetical protein